MRGFGDEFLSSMALREGRELNFKFESPL